MAIIPNSTFPKWIKWLCFTFIAVFVFLVLSRQSNEESIKRYAQELAQPTIFLNFNPDSSKQDSQGGWSYNIATSELQKVGDISQDVCDFDATRNTLLGICAGVVTETNISDGTSLPMGVAKYDGANFVPHTLQWRPCSKDYSALTQNGILVLWEAETGSYRELARFDWYKYAFAYSWLEDGKRVCVPDEDGIAVLNIETLAQYHWLTVEIPYSDGGPLPPACKRPFVVSPQGNLIVFCGRDTPDKMMISVIDEGGQLQSPVPLTDEQYDGQCWFDISSNGKDVIYGVVKTKNALFNPQFYEVYLYHVGEHFKILESKGSTVSGVKVFW